MRGRRAVAWALLAAWTSGCTLNAAPPRWLPTAKEAGVYGGWIRLEAKSGEMESRTEGELLALDADSVWVLTGDGTQAVPIKRVTKGSLTAYDPQAGRLANWTLFGALSTASHGVGLIISMPLWVLTGSLATAAHARSARREHPPLAWGEISMYARFPQGPPPGVDLHALRR